MIKPTQIIMVVNKSSVMVFTTLFKDINLIFETAGEFVKLDYFGRLNKNGSKRVTQLYLPIPVYAPVGNLRAVLIHLHKP